MKTEATLRRLFIESGLRGNRLTEAVASEAKRFKYLECGGQAYDRKMDLCRLKTFGNTNPELVEWIVEGWENRRAFRQGQHCRDKFGSLEENPYKSDGLELSMRRVTLHALWIVGFQSE